MRKNIYLLCSLLILISCSNYIPYQNANQIKSITNIPLKLSVDNVDCFFNNQIPNKPFYKVKVVEATGASNASYDELIISLKNKAKQEGLDAVLILDKQQETSYANSTEQIYLKDTTVSYNRLVASSYQKLTAIGIKYAENINYLDTIVKSTTFAFGNHKIKYNGDVNFDFYGNQIAGNNIDLNLYYLDSIEPYETERHLQLSVNNWQYKTSEAVGNNVVAFKNEINGIIMASAKIDYNDAFKFYYKVLNPQTNKESKYVLKIEKDFKGRITKKILSQKNNIIWVEEIYYAKNITTGCKRYRNNNNKEEIIFTATNNFFSVKDLPKPLENQME